MGWKKQKAPFTLAYLKARLYYEPISGRWTRLNRKKSNKAGHTMSSGYLRMRVGKHRCLAHVLAWFYMTGRWPRRIVDHVDNDNTNLRWDNLRLASWVQNRVNSKCRRDNKSGFKGVCKNRGRFIAYICVDKKRYNLGMYATAQLAHAAYIKAAKKYYGAFARAA
jgi:hypothetical protein